MGISENVNRHPIFNVKINNSGIIKPFEKTFGTTRRQKIKKTILFRWKFIYFNYRKIIKIQKFLPRQNLRL